MKSRIVYKVVLNEKGKLLSSFVGWTETRTKVFCKEYGIRELTLPVPGTKLFAFTNLRHAKNYQAMNVGTSVYEAVATNVKSEKIWFDGYASTLKDLLYWSKQGRAALPLGFESAVTCDSIMLLRKIE